MKRLLTILGLLILFPACRCKKHTRIHLAPLTKQTAEYQYKKDNITVYSHILTPQEKYDLFAGRALRCNHYRITPIQITIKNKESSTLYFDPHNCSIPLIDVHSLIHSMQKNAFIFPLVISCVNFIPPFLAIHFAGSAAFSFFPIILGLAMGDYIDVAMGYIMGHIIQGLCLFALLFHPYSVYLATVHDNKIVEYNIAVNMLEKTLISPYEMVNGILFVHQKELRKGLSLQLQKIGNPQQPITIHALPPFMTKRDE